ncbi:MAG: hypothetical protein HYZ48_01070, partial [Chlamydiales bacterium]|nr:hypothetical protein [Chlamydiales bacterium]
TPHAPKAIGPYSQAVAFENFVFLSGQIPIDPVSSQIQEKTIEGQTKQVFANIEAILQAEGLGFSDIIKVEVYLADMKDFQAVNTLYAQKFSNGVKPARQLMQVARLPLDSLIEISCIAIRRTP